MLKKKDGISITELTRRVGEIFKLCRKKRGLTQIEVANKAGLTQAAVSRIEKGLCSSSIDTLIKISQALGIKLSTVFEIIESKKKPQL